MQSSATETSVQFSLAELKQLHERRQTEQVAAEHRAEAERKAELSAARAARKQERLRLIRDRADSRRARLIEQQRMALAERQMHIEAEARLEQQRVELMLRQTEVELAKAAALAPRRNRALWFVVSLALAAQLAVFAYVHRTAQAQDTASVQLIGLDARADALIAAGEVQSERVDALAGAVADLSERLEAVASKPAARPETKASVRTRPKPRPRPGPDKPAKIIVKCGPNSDALCGLKR